MKQIQEKSHLVRVSGEFELPRVYLNKNGLTYTFSYNHEISNSRLIFLYFSTLMRLFSCYELYSIVSDVHLLIHNYIHTYVHYMECFQIALYCCLCLQNIYSLECVNGCCRSKPCLNGGTCTELCREVKWKFNCTCPSLYKGRVCEEYVTPRSCKDHLRGTPSGTKGVYTIYDESGVAYSVYCQKADSGKIWNLVESFAIKNSVKYSYKPFWRDFPVNHLKSAITWQDYRLPYKMMKQIRDRSESWRATCNFDTLLEVKKSRDYMRVLFSDYDLLSASGLPCIRVKKVKLLGVSCPDQDDCTLPFFNGAWHPHVDQTWHPCKLPQQPYTVVSADYFGFYHHKDSNHECSTTQDSTTQWWFGEI